MSKDHEKTPGGLVPLPAKKCYECRKSCRVAPLIACDYCSLFFHLDCLDPPLTAPPTGRWMCPNHVEHFLDSKLLTSISATERVALWDKFTGPIDQDAVKLQFIRKINARNPPFRVKVKLPPRNRVKVPPMVKYHYQKPVHLLPSLRDVLRLNTVMSRQNSNNIDVGETQEETTVQDEQEREENCENDDVVCVESENKCSEDCKLENCTMKCKGCYDINCGDSDVDNNGVECNYSIQNSDDLITNNKDTSNVNDRIRDYRTREHNKTSEDTVYNGFTRSEYVNGAYCHHEIKKENCAITGDVSDISEVELELKQLDDRLIKLLAFQRIQQLLSQQANSQTSLSPYLSLNHDSKLHHMPLPSELLTPADIDRISRVFSSPKKKVKPKPTVRARAMFCPVVSQHFYNIKTSEVDPANLRHDASFMGLRPTVSSRFPDAVPMKYRVINVGKGSANEIDLERFGNCNCISPRHAVIFYDDFTRQFELINYSVHGTHVNNVLYSNDVTKERAVPKDVKESKIKAVENKVREIIDKKRKVTRPRRQFLEKMTANDYIDRVDCCCVGNGEDLKSGWEGSALLNHGALLRFGCISFVFSIVDCAP